MERKVKKKPEETEQELPLEELFLQIEDQISRLEEPDVSLEESFQLYEQGVRTLKLCNQKIDLVEKKMLMLNQQGELEPFDQPEEKETEE